MHAQTHRWDQKPIYSTYRLVHHKWKHLLLHSYTPSTPRSTMIHTCNVLLVALKQKCLYALGGYSYLPERKALHINSIHVNSLYLYFLTISSPCYRAADAIVKCYLCTLCQSNHIYILLGLQQACPESRSCDKRFLKHKFSRMKNSLCNTDFWLETMSFW